MFAPLCNEGPNRTLIAEIIFSNFNDSRRGHKADKLPLKAPLDRPRQDVSAILLLLFREVQVPLCGRNCHAERY